MMKVRENISLLGMNSFGFDVSARRLVEFASAEDLRAENSPDTESCCRINRKIPVFWPRAGYP